MFKLTLNKPAFNMFFEGEQVKGIRLRMDEQGFSFLPVKKDSGQDIVPIVERGRGGLEANIDGSEGKKLLKHLRNPTGNPFFTLVRSAEGWVQAIPYDPEAGGMPEPPRFKPHVRLWVKDGPRALPGHMLSHFQGMDLPQFVETVRDAHQKVTSYNDEKRSGRPPKDVADAQLTIKVLSELAREYLPDVDNVRRAYELLGEYLAKSGAAKTETAELPRGPGRAMPSPNVRGRNHEAPEAETVSQPRSAHAERRAKGKYRVRRTG